MTYLVLILNCLLIKYYVISNYDIINAKLYCASGYCPNHTIKTNNMISNNIISFNYYQNIEYAYRIKVKLYNNKVVTLFNFVLDEKLDDDDIKEILYNVHDELLEELDSKLVKSIYIEEVL
jgi:hypothetical protein